MRLFLLSILTASLFLIVFSCKKTGPSQTEDPVTIDEMQAPDDFNYENQDIKASFGSTNNFRAGTEWRYSNFSFRGGYAMYGSPYQNDLNDGKRTMYSGGIGYRTRDYSVDFAYVYSVMYEDYYLYTSSIPEYNPNAVNNKFTTSQFVLSVKFFMN